MKNRLEEILRSVHEMLEARRSPRLREELRARASARGRALSLGTALRRPEKGTAEAAPLRVIGELKRQSPSAGLIRDQLDPVPIAVALEQAGVTALSILTEPDWFGGSLEHLAAVRTAVEIPLLQKDFVVDPFQVLEARAYGADAILLIAAVLDDEALLRCREEAERWGLSTLAEAHDEPELQRLSALDVSIIGVNARDLRSFDVDLQGALARASQLPDDRIVVVESGVRTRSDARRVAIAPVDAVLVGEGLMRDSAPERRYRELFAPELG